MSVIVTKLTRGVIKSINEKRLLSRLTSIHAMRKAMNIQGHRRTSSSHAFGTPIAKTLLMFIFPTKRAMVQEPIKRHGLRGQITILHQVRSPLGLRTRSINVQLSTNTRSTHAMGEATWLPKNLSSNTSLLFDTAKAKIKCMSIFLVEGAMEGWFGKLRPKNARSTLATRNPLDIT
jgi:hypothetical protein